MTQKQFIKDVAARARVTVLVADSVLAAAGKEAAVALAKDGMVKVPHLANMVAKEYEARPGRNPKTGEEREVPAAVRIRIKPATKLELNFAAELSQTEQP